MILVLVAAALGFGLAAATYLLLERGGRRLLAPLLARGVAWSVLLLLLLNAGFARPPAAQRPIVLLDASLSMQSAGGKWSRALDSARGLGDVRFFGDERPGRDSAPDRGASRLLPALTAAAASDRAVVVLTDGELDDGGDLPADLEDRATMALLTRDSIADYALTQFQGPARITSGDTLLLEGEVRAINAAPERNVGLTVSMGGRLLRRQTVHVPAGGTARARFSIPTRGLPPGAHALAMHLESGDSEPRTDTRLRMVTIAATPGIVLVATPGDWDSRALYRALVDVAELPVRGYVELGQGRYRGMHDLKPVGEETVRRAAAAADLLVVKGDAKNLVRNGGARGLWLWPSGAGAVAGDWYISAAAGTPVSGAFLGLPVDSFAPATRLSSIEARQGDWVALEAQDRRRGPQRPAVVGHVEGRRRVVTVAVDGLWRWAFRGGQSEQAYRNWVAATASWLLAAPDTAVGAVRLTRSVVQQGRPLVFEWAGSGAPNDLAIGWQRDSSTGTDTLHFDAAGRALLWLPPGTYAWRLARGGAGQAAVETYSDEFLPRPRTVSAHAARLGVPGGRTSVRDWRWLFGVAIIALALEWWWRRRLGLR
ncbi:MAG TPA: hypothetical protein VFL88_08280 [Gemmatimonadales bacterium]|nr:hypothetical protein [Gemmatimonadales bacterium]